MKMHDMEQVAEQDEMRLERLKLTSMAHIFATGAIVSGIIGALAGIYMLLSLFMFVLIASTGPSHLTEENPDFKVDRWFILQAIVTNLAIASASFVAFWCARYCARSSAQAREEAASLAVDVIPANEILVRSSEKS